MVLSISVRGCRGGKLLLWALDIAIYNSEGSMIVRKHFALEVNEPLDSRCLVGTSKQSVAFVELQAIQVLVVRVLASKMQYLCSNVEYQEAA